MVITREEMRPKSYWAQIKWLEYWLSARWLEVVVIRNANKMEIKILYIRPN